MNEYRIQSPDIWAVDTDEGKFERKNFGYQGSFVIDKVTKDCIKEILLKKNLIVEGQAIKLNEIDNNEFEIICEITKLLIYYIKKVVVIRCNECSPQ